MKRVVEPVRLTEMATGIVQVRLPLPFRLDHVNCYLLRGDNGWTVLDTGLNTSLARRGWELAFAELGLGPDEIERIVLSHVHPDHFGLAGWLQVWLAEQGRTAPLPVLMSAPEYEVFTDVWEQPEQQLERMTAYFVRGGMPVAMARDVSEETGRTGQRTWPHPAHIGVIYPGAELDLGWRRFRVLQGSGHSPGLLMLHDEASGVLLCSDHMLIKITPHIGFWPGMADEPLTGYLASLRQLQSLPVSVAYPGHRDPIPDWSGRLGELLAHHAARLEATYEAIPAGTAQNVAQIATTVFRLGDLNPHEMRFAMAETWSHIVWLVKAGRLLETEVDGVAEYRRA